MYVPGTRLTGRSAIHPRSRTIILRVDDKMDVFGYLPLELVATILIFLPSEDLVSCLQVSSKWRQLVSSFGWLWTRRCLDYGLPDYLVDSEPSVDPVALFLAARRQRCYVTLSKHKIFPDIRSMPKRELERSSNSEALDEEQAAVNTISVHPRQVHSAGNGILVVVMFGPRQGAGTTTGSFGVTSRLSTRAGSFTPYSELKQRYQFEFILIERLNTSSGRTEEVCRIGLEDKWKWPVIIRAFAAKDQSWVVLCIKETWIETAWYKIMLHSKATSRHSSSVLQLPDFSSLHHPSNPYDVSCCCECSTIALVKNKLSMRPPWECNIDMLDISQAPEDQQIKQHTIPILSYDKLRLSSDVHANVVFRPTFFCQQSSELGSCVSHKLVLWRTNDHIITVHTHTEEGISETPVATFNPIPQGKTLELSTAWRNAKVKFSADFQLLGFLMACYLHLWNMNTCVKLHTIYLEGIPGLRSWMLAIGHVYSLFGTLHEGGEMAIVSTQTGQVVWKCKDFLQPGLEIENLQQFHMVVHEDWMSDVYKLCSANAPFFLYSCTDPSGSITISGLAFLH